MSVEEQDSVYNRIKFINEYEKIPESSIYIEAVTENLEVKKQIFEFLDSIAPEDSILASNTSSLSITKLGSFTNRPDKVIGMHFMNPVPKMNLVEVIAGVETSEDTMNETIK